MYVCVHAGLQPSESDMVRNIASLNEIKVLYPKHEAVRSCRTYSILLIYCIYINTFHVCLWKLSCVYVCMGELTSRVYIFYL